MFKTYARFAAAVRRLARPTTSNSGGRQVRSRQRLVLAAFEGLENRKLFSTSITFANGVLTVTGDPTAKNSLTADLTAGGTKLFASTGQSKTMTVPLSAVKGLAIVGGSAADYIYVESDVTVPVTINGGNGNDQVRGGGGANTITEGDGNAWVSGRGTTNYVRTGNGNDTLLGSTGNDTLLAGNGNDSLDGADGNDSLVAGNGRDSIAGDSGNDTITAGNGADSLNGGLGNDRITVGTGLSTVAAGSGANTVTVGNPADPVSVSGGGSISYVTAAGVTTATPVTGTNTTSAGTPTWRTYTAAAAVTTPVATPVGINPVAVATPADATAAPVAVLQILNTPAVAGLSVVTRGLNSVLGDGSQIDANYQWDFGDPTGAHDTLTGYNASHVYATPGSYAISLTVTNDLGSQSTVQAQVAVAADARRDVYVDAVNGNDANTGATSGLAVATAARANQLLGNDTDLLFARGQTFPLNSTLKLQYRDVLVGAYGTGANPVLTWAGTAAGSNIISTNSASSVGVTVQDLTLTSLYGQSNMTDAPFAVAAGGYGTSVLRCTFAYVQYAVNANGSPTGLTVEDDSSPLPDGINGYFVWGQGNDLAVIGNTVAGSVREHNLRTTGTTELLVSGNTFTNNDGKGCIEVHNGASAWVTGNSVTNGDIRVGPLGLWGEAVTSATDGCVIQDNLITGSCVTVDPGAHDISIRNNVISRNTAIMINVTGRDAQGRQASDIRILNNTGISTGTAGNFLKVESHVVGITLENNLLVAPNLTTGGYNAAPVYALEGNLSSFAFIGNNVWQRPATIYSYAQGGVNLIPGLTSSGYVTPSAWNAMTVVGTDLFSGTPIDAATYAPSARSAAASDGLVLSGVYGDFYGNARPTSGSWTVGAVQD